jgi:hypothetical protein
MPVDMAALAADLALAVEGPGAQESMAIAQAFAGPPGPGRPPIRKAQA